MNLTRIFAEQICPACGYKLNFTPWIDDDQERACPCCGIHFGYDDADERHREGIYKSWRRRWLSYGKRWWRGNAPSDYNPDEQLARLEVLAEEPPEWPGAN